MTGANGHAKKSKNFQLNFAQIRVRNTPNEATLSDGSKIYRNKEGKIWVEGLGRPVKTLDYDNHFVALDPSKKKGRWFALCSCGSPAVVAGYNAYRQGASAGTDEDGMVAGEMLVCYFHAMYARHADGST